MPRYTSDQSKKGLEEAILGQLRKQFRQDEKSLPASSENYARLSRPVVKDVSKIIKDVSKIGAGFAAATVKNPDLGDILGLQDISVPYFLSRAADPAHFERMVPEIQKKYEHATGKMTFLGLLTEPKKDEPPVFFLLYGTEGDLRAYVPKKGNSFSKKGKMPAGPAAKTRPLHELFDVAALKQGIQSRFQYVGDKGLSFLPEAKFPKARGPQSK